VAPSGEPPRAARTGPTTTIRDPRSDRPPPGGRLEARVVRLLGVVGGVIVGIGMLGLWYLSRGEPNVSPGQAAATVLDAIQGRPAADADVTAYLILELRLPRLLLGLVAGAGLGLSGVILQDTLRNPIADPSLLGVSSAAALGVAVLFFFPGLVPEPLTPAVALGAGLAAGTVLVLLARSIRDPIRLILIGALMAALLTTVTSIVLLLAPNTGGFNVARFMTYQVGSLSGASLDKLGAVLPWLGLAIPLALLGARTLNVLQLGDDVAAGLGMNVTRARFRLLVVAVLLVAPVVWVAGPIAFVALLSPHVARFALGSSNAYSVLPASAAIGAFVVLVADTTGRLLFFPTEVPVGIWTIAIVGPIAAFLAGPGLRAPATAPGPA
jgi:iron complex transport system permease protein